MKYRGTKFLEWYGYLRVVRMKHRCVFFSGIFLVTLVFRHPKSGNMINQKHETLDKVDLLERMVDGIGR